MNYQKSDLKYMTENITVNRDISAQMLFEVEQALTNLFAAEDSHSNHEPVGCWQPEQTTLF